MYRPRWVVPVLPKGELEVLLEAAIDLCKKGNALFLGLVYHLIFLLFSLNVLLSSSRSSINLYLRHLKLSLLLSKEFFSLCKCQPLIGFSLIFVSRI